MFPEIAGMSVQSDGLVEAIHGCELRLVHAHEAVLVSMLISLWQQHPCTSCVQPQYAIFLHWKALHHSP